MNRLPLAIALAGLAFAGFAGYFASSAIGQADEPVRTVTVDVGTGSPGPPGPPGPQGERGPAGPPGATVCPAGYTAADVRVNAPGGQVTFRTCVKD